MSSTLHEIYGSVELMASGRFVRRVTGFMGSPQNYSLYIGVMICLLYCSNIKKRNKYLTLTILLMGGLVSGSRAFSLFIFLTVVLTVLLNRAINVKNMNRTIKNILLFVFIIIAIYELGNINYLNATINRMVKFIGDWPALKIYLNHLNAIDFTTIWLGKGMGVNERIVVNLLGSRYYQMVGSYTNSYESYVLSLFMQSGLIGLIGFLAIYTKALINSFNQQNKLYFSVLIAIFINLLFTPSFNGLAMSYIIWPLILFPYYLKKEFLYNSIEKTSKTKKDRKIKLFVGMEKAHQM